MQQSRNLIPRQATKLKKPYATVPLCHCVTVCLYVCMSNRTLVSHICMVQTLCLDRAKAMFGWLKCPRSRT